MDLFHTTCFASQQTIMPNDTVLLFPVIQNTDLAKHTPITLLQAHTFSHTPLQGALFKESDTSEPVVFWDWFGPSLEAIYYQDGSFQLINSSTNKSRLEHFFNIVASRTFVHSTSDPLNARINSESFSFKSIYNPKKTYTFEQLCLIWQHLFAQMQAHNVFVKNLEDKVTLLQVATCLRHTANYFVASQALLNRKLRSHVSEGSSLKSIEYLQLEHYIAQELLNTNSFFAHVPRERKAQSLAQRLITFQGLCASGTLHYFYPAPAANAPEVVQLLDFLRQSSNVPQLPAPLIKALYQHAAPILKHQTIEHALRCMNIKIMPLSYTPADEQNERGAQYLKMVQFVHHLVQKDISKKYGTTTAEETQTKPVSAIAAVNQSTTTFIPKNAHSSPMDTPVVAQTQSPANHGEATPEVAMDRGSEQVTIAPIHTASEQTIEASLLSDASAEQKTVTLGAAQSAPPSAPFIFVPQTFEDDLEENQEQNTATNALSTQSFAQDIGEQESLIISKDLTHHLHPQITLAPKAQQEAPAEATSLTEEGFSFEATQACIATIEPPESESTDLFTTIASNTTVEMLDENEIQETAAPQVPLAGAVNLRSITPQSPFTKLPDPAEPARLNILVSPKDTPTPDAQLRLEQSNALLPELPMQPPVPNLNIVVHTAKEQEALRLIQELEERKKAVFEQQSPETSSHTNQNVSSPLTTKDTPEISPLTFSEKSASPANRVQKHPVTSPAKTINEPILDAKEEAFLMVPEEPVASADQPPSTLNILERKQIAPAFLSEHSSLAQLNIFKPKESAKSDTPESFQ